MEKFPMFVDLIQSALQEDLGSAGDITTNCVFSDEVVSFSVNAREDLVVSGMAIVSSLSKLYSEKVSFIKLVTDGTVIGSGNSILCGKGNASCILSIERTLLNFLQRASGISSMTRRFVDAVAGTKAKIRSTRKTAPCLRKFDLYAVHVGGGESYRSGLFDGIMVKDNHITSLGGITACVSRIREKLGKVVLTVECDNLSQVEESLRNSVDVIMLDNMDISNISKAVEMISSRAKIEVSGGVNIDNVVEIANTGVDYISIGSLTNSFKCKDIGLDIT